MRCYEFSNSFPLYLLKQFLLNGYCAGSNSGDTGATTGAGVGSFSRSRRTTRSGCPISAIRDSLPFALALKTPKFNSGSTKLHLERKFPYCAINLQPLKSLRGFRS